jgi:hypothetical protein
MISVWCFETSALCFRKTLKATKLSRDSNFLRTTILK